MTRLQDAWFTATVATGGVLLLVAQWTNRDALNTDAVAYLRLAGYYASGRWDLAISGYWSALLAWLIGALLLVGLEPLAAARAVMAVTAVVFTAGVHSVMLAFGISSTAVRLGTVLALFASIYWSVHFIGADLLVAGLVGIATSRLASDRWLDRRAGAAAAGFWWGLAYLAKAIAAPLAVLVTIAFAVLRAWLRPNDLRLVAGRAALTLIAFALTITPWVGVLSAKYGAPTLSTTARIAHTVAGPKDVDRTHPFARTLHRPRPGRVTAFEEPSELPYRSWSPFESPAYAKFQLQRIASNVRSVAALLWNADVLHLGTISIVLAVAVSLPLRRRLALERWRWMLVPLGAIAALYAPVYFRPTDSRYLYPAYPFLLGASFGAAEWLSGFERRAHTIAITIVALSYGVPAVVSAGLAVCGLPRDAATLARELASRLERTAMVGPVAGDAKIGNERTGLFVAFFLDQPWHGASRDAGPLEFLDSGAELVVLSRPRDAEQIAAMHRHPDFVDLAPRLFPNGGAGDFPLVVFRSRRAVAPESRNPSPAG